jgi:radical SAM superfamily enzyme YgiQ (UPF0313 family)
MNRSDSTQVEGSHVEVSHDRVKVGLVQINNSFSGANYFPYSVGLLQAYIQKHANKPTRYDFTLPVYARIPINLIVDQLRGVDVAGFSAYVWNIKISLEAARRTKEESPDTIIVFGGPQVPDRAEEFLRQYPFIDIVCHGEGEAVMLDILERFPGNDWDEISSISYLSENGDFITHSRAPRIKELDVVPSPYTEGVFAPLIEAYPDEQWLVLWETNRGCPFSCTFCDWGSATAAKVYRFDLDRLFEEIEWFAREKVEFVFCCDANFGILKRDYDIVEYAAKTKERSGYPQALSVQNTKNATERAYKVQKLLNDAGLNKGVTIALQSVEPATLEAIKRKNISTESFQELQRRFTKDRVVTYSDMILGLPGETYSSFADGVSSVIANGQHNRIQFGNLSILPNAEMGDPAYQREFGMEIIESDIINIHGSLNQVEEDIVETQQLVVATKDMSREAWVKTRAFAWMTAFVHFNKVLQIPLVLVHELCDVSYRELIECFSDIKSDRWPVLTEVRDFFIAKAVDIQNGGYEYCYSAEWLDIFWPADEYMMIKLCKEDKIEDLYRESEEMLQQFLADNYLDLPGSLLHDAIELNKELLKKPFQTTDQTVTTSYNIWEYYRSVLVGEMIPSEEIEVVYHVDRTNEQWTTWEDWYREVIWYGNKKGAYLYGNKVAERQFAGHH